MTPETRSEDLLAAAHGLPDPVQPVQPALGHSPPQALAQNAKPGRREKDWQTDRERASAAMENTPGVARSR
jgi:hypothetical protein